MDLREVRLVPVGNGTPGDFTDAIPPSSSVAKPAIDAARAPAR